MKTLDEIFTGPVKPRGLVHVTGPAGVGKSLFAIGLVELGLDPQRIGVLDCEQSLALYHLSLGFGVYHDVTAEVTSKFGIFYPPRAYFQYMQECIKNMPQLDVIVVDNIDPLEDGIEDEVETNHVRYGLSKEQVERAGGLKWGPIKILYQTFILSLSNKAPLYIFTSQLKQVWIREKPVPGLFRPSGKQDVLSYLSSLRLWLNFSSTGRREPDGLVMKHRLVQFFRTDNGIEPRPLLPPKLSPCTWSNILHYINNPPDYRALKPHEVVSDEERAKLSGTLTKEQIELLRLISEPEQRVQASGMAKVPTTLAEFVAALPGLNLSLTDALARLGKTRVDEINPTEDFLRLQEG